MVTVNDVDDSAPKVKITRGVQLEAIGQLSDSDETPQVTKLGSGGEYVVTWSGRDSMGDFSIFVQRFTSSDRLSGSAVQLEATGKTDGADATPKITAVGTAGDFVVTWSGVDSAGDTSIFVQKFHANGNINGNAVQLEAIGKTDGADLTPEIAAVGTDGEFVVTWSGVDSGGDASIFVQKFHANGMISANSAVQLEAISRTNGADLTPQVMAVGSAGEYVVTWSGVDSSAGGDSSIFVQKFHANGTIIANSLVQLEATGKMNGIDIAPQVLNLGSDGEYVVLWQGSDTGNDASILYGNSRPTELPSVTVCFWRASAGRMQRISLLKPRCWVQVANLWSHGLG